MPLVEVPIYSALPETLYAGAFKHINNDLYMFQYAPWFFDSKHALGWSREIVYLHKYGDNACPCKLVGDAFQKSCKLGKFEGQWRNDYTIENTTEPVSFDKLYNLAIECINALESADVHLDAWGCKSIDDWDNENMHSWHMKRQIETFTRELEGKQRGKRDK